MNSPGHSQPCRCSECAPGEHAHRAPLLSLYDLSFEREGRRILTDINFTVDRGDFIAITGPNGGGKTTLMRLILGLLKPTRGRICHFDPSGQPNSRPSRPGYLPQKNSVDSHFPISIRSVIASGLLGEHLSRADERSRVDAVLELIGLSDIAGRPIGRLSGGQLQRALFGRAIVAKPSVLILDEPLSYLDVEAEKRMYDVIEHIAPSTTILLVSHQMNVIAGMANRHVIVDGHLHECTSLHHYAAPECR